MDATCYAQGLDTHKSGATEVKMAPPRTFLFAASCPGLAIWARELGFPVLYLGISDDPLASIQDMCATDYGRGAIALDDVQPDLRHWTDWTLTSFAGTITRSVAVEPWGGTMRVTLPQHGTSRLLASRLTTLLSPLDAFRVTSQPEAIHARRARGAMPPPSPRYTYDGDDWVVAQGLYRWSVPGDSTYVSRSLEAAISSFVLGGSALDLIAEEARGLSAAIWCDVQ